MLYMVLSIIVFAVFGLTLWASESLAKRIRAYSGQDRRKS